MLLDTRDTLLGNNWLAKGITCEIDAVVQCG